MISWTSFNLSGSAPPPVVETLPGDPTQYAYVLISNETAYDLNVQYAGVQKLISAWTLDCFAITGTGTFTGNIDAAIAFSPLSEWVNFRQPTSAVRI